MRASGVATVTLLATIWCGGCDRRQADAEREAARAKINEAGRAAADAQRVKRRLEERDTGVLTTPPAWAPPSPPPAEADELKADLDPLEVLVRYRRPPGDAQDCLEYYVEGVVKRRMSFTKEGADGTTWFPRDTRDALHDGFVIHFLGPDGRDARPKQVVRFDGHVLAEQEFIAFSARLTPDEVRRVRKVRFENLGFSGGGVPAPAPAGRR